MSYPFEEGGNWFDRYVEDDVPFDVVLDTETTGLSHDAQIVSIGWSFSVKKDYAHLKDGRVHVYSGSFTIRPDMERIANQDQNELHEALQINGLKFEDLESHEIPYHNASRTLINRIQRQMRKAGLFPSKMNVRYLAYNWGFDSVRIAMLPGATEIINRMPRMIYESGICENYRSHSIKNNHCLCEARPGCIMLNHSEWKDGQGWGSRWSKLVDAFNTHFGNLPELDFYWVRENGDETKLDRITSVELQVNAHDAEFDCLMAEIVNYHLKVWRGF